MAKGQPNPNVFAFLGPFRRSNPLFPATAMASCREAPRPVASNLRRGPGPIPCHCIGVDSDRVAVGVGRELSGSPHFTDLKDWCEI
jgi:hypothetical protein